MTSLVPLQSPFAGSIFRSNITGHPILNFKTCGGNPLGVNVFRKVGSSYGDHPWRYQNYGTPYAFLENDQSS
jgi:hypothetical protein